MIINYIDKLSRLMFKNEPSEKEQKQMSKLLEWCQNEENNTITTK